MQRSFLFSSFLLASFLFLSSCAGGRLTTRSASQKLKPIAPLPEREQSQLPVNLLVKIDNVADAISSYRNYVVLFINGKEIALDDPENNLQSTYEYSLRLQPGIYRIKAEYHAVGFWKERVFAINTDEPVKILPGKRTELSVRLDKDSRGFLRTKKNLFNIRFAALGREGELLPAETRIESDVSAPQIATKNPVILPELAIQNEEQGIQSTAIPSQSLTGKIKLQVNTVPLGANVYVDDRFVGQSPVRIEVTSREGHIIQVAREGFKEYLKVLDPVDLAGRADLQIIIRLERRE